MGDPWLKPDPNSVEYNMASYLILTPEFLLSAKLIGKLLCEKL